MTKRSDTTQDDNRKERPEHKALKIAYLQMGKDRSIRELARKTGKKIGPLYQLSGRFKWKAAAQKWDADEELAMIDEAHALEAEKRLEARKTRQVMGSLLFNRAVMELLGIDEWGKPDPNRQPMEWRASDALKAIDISKGLMDELESGEVTPKTMITLKTIIGTLLDELEATYDQVDDRRAN